MATVYTAEPHTYHTLDTKKASSTIVHTVDITHQNITSTQLGIVTTPSSTDIQPVNLELATSTPTTETIVLEALPASKPTPTTTATDTYSVFHGAFPDFGGTEDIVTTERLAEFETLAGKQLSFAQFSNNWTTGIKFPADDIATISEYGITPLIRIMPRSSFRNQKQSDYTLYDIATGVYDNELITWAQQARDTNTPLLITFAPEMNGDWFSWGGRHNGGGTTDDYGDTTTADGPEVYKDAYRHIITLFKEQQASNVSWLFQINATPAPHRAWNTPENYYPGDEYIDWLGISVYGATTQREQTTAFDTLLAPAYEQVTNLAPNKPVMIAEFGITERDSKPSWIQTALTSIASELYPNVQAISYWHESWGSGNSAVELRIDSSTQSNNNYRTGIAQPVFISTPLLPR